MQHETAFTQLHYKIHVLHVISTSLLYESSVHVDYQLIPYDITNQTWTLSVSTYVLDIVFIWIYIYIDILIYTLSLTTITHL